MCDFQVCRVCLRTDKSVKYYKYDEYYLKCYYEEITTVPMNINDGLPKYFCYQCAALLNKFHFFKEKCCYTQITLISLIATGPLTYEKIGDFHSTSSSLINRCNIELIKANNNVKTYNMTYSTSVPKKSKPVVKESESESSDTEVNFLADNDTDSEDNLPITQITIGLKKDDGEESYDIFEEERVDKKPEEEETQETEPIDFKAVDEKAEIETDNHILKDLLTKQTKVNSRKKSKWLNVKKKSPLVSETETKTYKFTKSKDGKVKALQFLDSGFWKKLTLSEEEAMKDFEEKGTNEKYLRAAYKCTDCHKSFSQKSMMDRHMLRKHGEDVGALVCRFCKMRFRRACFLSRHLKQHLTRYECLRCNLVCNVETTALFHEEYHSGVIRKCPHCHKEFKHLSTFYTHLRTHRSKHMCSLCGESFVSPLGLRQHKRLKHVIEEECVGATDSENNIYCEVCKITFESKEAYTKHLLHSAMHTDDFSSDSKPETERDEDSQEDGDEKVDEKDNKPRQLYERKSKVEKTLSAVRKSNLPAVAGRGWTKKPTTCQHCGKHFASQTACRKHHLAEHLRSPFHTEKDRIICEVCGASLAPGSVAAHLNQHTRRKMYTCETCGRSFTTNHVLRNHMATHTGERNYACSICGKRFTQNGSLSLHYRTVHLKQPYVRDRKKKLDETNIGAFFGKQEFL